jgi:hypothetical protein
VSLAKRAAPTLTRELISRITAFRSHSGNDPAKLERERHELDDLLKADQAGDPEQ